MNKTPPPLSLPAALALTLTFLGSAPTGRVGAEALDVVIVSLSSLTIFLVPLIALLISHDAIVGDIERGTMLASVDFSAFTIAAIAARAILRHLDGQPVPAEIMTPAELIDRSNFQRWKVPFDRRACPAWEEIVR